MIRIDVDEWQIRSFCTQDAEALARYANNRNVSRNLRDAFPYPYTLAHAETWISFAAQQSTESDFAIASEAELLGGIGISIQRDVHRRSAEVGYWLGEPFWGRGIATASLRAFTEWAFSQFDLLRLYGYVYEWNPASARVKGGGKLGQAGDSIVGPSPHFASATALALAEPVQQPTGAIASSAISSLTT